MCTRATDRPPKLTVRASRRVSGRPSPTPSPASAAPQGSGRRCVRAHSSLRAPKSNWPASSGSRSTRWDLVRMVWRAITRSVASAKSRVARLPPRRRFRRPLLPSVSRRIGRSQAVQLPPTRPRPAKLDQELLAILSRTAACACPLEQPPASSTRWVLGAVTSISAHPQFVPTFYFRKA